MSKKNCENDDDDEIQNAIRDQQQQQDVLFCDALPLSTSVELNLTECLTGVSTTYSGITTITFQIEEPSTCLFFHVDNSKIKIEKLHLQQGKHVLRPKCIYEMDSFAFIIGGTSSSKDQNVLNGERKTKKSKKKKPRKKKTKTINKKRR
jgi:hypothetical protein